MIADLVTQARNNDQDAWNELYNQTCKGAYFVALKVCGKEQDALDLVQDAYLNAYTQLEQLQDPAKFQPWFNMIVANKCRDYLKKKRPTLFSELGNEDDPQPEWEDDREYNLPEQHLDREETSRIVAELINALPEEQRLCVLLYYQEEMSVSEIAQALQVSDGTVKSRLNYARKKVADKVNELEKKGTKLYGLAPVPFLVWLLHEEAEAASVPAALAATATTTAAVSGATTAAASAAVASQTVAVTGIKGLLSGIGAKVAAGIAVAAIVVGGSVGVYNAISVASKTFDLGEYLVVEKFTGLNGQGAISYYLDEDALMYDILQEYEAKEITEENFEEVMMENLEILEEVGNALSCITVTATPAERLSNGDTVILLAKFENNSNYEISYRFKDAEKSITVSGLIEGTTFDPFAEDNMSVLLTGYSGVGEMSVEVAPSDSLPLDLFQLLDYDLSQWNKLSNGDTVTLSVSMNESRLTELGYLMPETTEKEIMISGLPELVDASYQFTNGILQSLLDNALMYSQSDEQQYLNDYTITAPSSICGIYFINSIDRHNPYHNIMEGLVAQNAIVIATNYVMEYDNLFNSEVSRTFVFIFPNWAINANGDLAYESENVVCRFASYVDLDNFTEWMDMEFNYVSKQVEITPLEF